jgi:hypothetical protein
LQGRASAVNAIRANSKWPGSRCRPKCRRNEGKPCVNKTDPRQIYISPDEDGRTQQRRNWSRDAEHCRRVRSTAAKNADVEIMAWLDRITKIHDLNINDLECGESSGGWRGMVENHEVEVKITKWYHYALIYKVSKENKSIINPWRFSGWRGFRGQRMRSRVKDWRAENNSSNMWKIDIHQ